MNIYLFKCKGCGECHDLVSIKYHKCKKVKNENKN